MHPNKAFRRTSESVALAAARDRSFGTISVNGPVAPHLSHVPFLLADDGQSLDLHLLRSNPIARALPAQAVMSVVGPEGYISPDWYGVPDQVPTWNYVAVHLHGWLEQLPDDALRDMLDRQSAHFETLLLPKRPWTTDKMSEGVMENMMRAIVPVRMVIEDVQSTFKLNQNKPDDVRLRAADHVAEHGDQALSRLMKDPPG